METYEYPLGVTFKASTPEHAAARVFGGKPSDYLATVHGMPIHGRQWLDVSSPDGRIWYGDIPIVSR